MNYKTHNNSSFSIGSCFKGYLKADYKEIKKLFGKPREADNYKIDAKWEVYFDDGIFATIYNYKDGKNYLGRKGMAKTKITDWYIGGNSPKALTRIRRLIENNRAK